MSFLPVFGLEESSTKDKIVSILVSNPSITTKQVCNALRKQYAVNITYQGVHKTLKEMVASKNLIAEDGKYKINKEWIQSIKNFINYFEVHFQHDNFEQISKQIFSIDDNKIINLNLKNLNQLLHFLDKFEDDFCKYYNDNTIITEQYPHNLRAIKSSYAKKKSNLIRYVLCKGNTILDNLSIIQNPTNNLFMRTGAEDVSEILYVFNDFIVTVKVYDSLMKSIDDNFNSVKDLKDFDMERFDNLFEMESDIIISIQKNKTLAKFHQKSLFDKFIWKFEGLLDSFLRQKKEGKRYFVDLRYHYLTMRQLYFLEKANKVRDETKTLYPEEIELLDKYASKLIFDKFDKESIKILELGSGDCNNTLKILSRWYSRYHIYYEGVESSKLLIEKAKDNLSTQLPDIDYKLINKSLSEYCEATQKNPSHNGEKIVILLGFLYGNYEKEDISKWISEIVNPNDFLIIGMQTIKDKSMAELKKVTKKFEDDYSKNMNLSVLYELGFSEKDLHYEVRFNEKTNCVEGIAKILNMPQHLVAKIKDVNFSIGDEILLFFSWKPTINELKEELSKNYYPELHLHDETGVVIAVLRKRSGLKLHIKEVEIKMIQGERGIYSTDLIKKGTKIFDYKGKILNYRTKHTLQIDENKHLEGPIIFDHSCNANCKIDWETFEIVAGRDIQKGEKLTFNYLSSEEELAHPFSCYCHEPNCKILVKGFKYLSKKEKKELEPILSPFLKKKYSEELRS